MSPGEDREPQASASTPRATVSRDEGDQRSAELTRRIAGLAAEKAATEIVALDVGTLVGYTDYLIVCSARNERQAKAVHDTVYETLKKRDGMLPARVEGAREARWILMDYLDCVLHILVPEMRDRYRLEQLWGEAPRFDLGLDAEAGVGEEPQGG